MMMATGMGDFGNMMRKRGREDEGDGIKKVFVAGLPFNVDWQELKRYFRTAGTVVYAGVMKDKEKGTSKGCGVVEFETAEQAQNAIQLFNGTQMAGRTIYVRLDQDNAIGGMGDGQSAAKKLASGGMGAGMGAGMYGGIGMGGNDGSLYGSSQGGMMGATGMAGMGAGGMGGMNPLAQFAGLQGAAASGGNGMGGAGMGAGMGAGSGGMSGGVGMGAAGGMAGGVGMGAGGGGMPGGGMGTGGMGAGGMGSSGMGTAGMGAGGMGAGGMNAGGMGAGGMGAGGMGAGGMGADGLVGVANAVKQAQQQQQANQPQQQQPTGGMQGANSMASLLSMANAAAGGGMGGMAALANMMGLAGMAGMGGMPGMGMGAMGMGAMGGMPGLGGLDGPQWGAMGPMAGMPPMMGVPPIMPGMPPMMGPGPGPAGLPGRRLFVNNLSFETEWRALKDHFKQCGPVAYSKIIVDKETNKSKGCGIVEFENPRDAMMAMQKLDGSILDGRTIHVREDQQEGMPPPGMGPMGGMGPMMGGGGGGGGNRSQRGDRERKANVDPEMRKTCQIVVHGLPFSYEAAQLRDLVKGSGPILECEVKKDRITGRSKGWGTVLFQNAEAANAAIEKFNGHDLHGRVLSVKLDAHVQ
ncbi:hypothetical protein Vafri_3055 [Volvox africanus]|uniref:RRM domain-containing protein n=2 Tax=Volvox africanus TaxID=51714 RepID=A0A8J4AQP8_9CHLO|nr:hypothetical protein Vafri_3055 [Volvox africanus]